MKKLKEKLNAKLSKNGGFTLVEMLIVVAIIAILVAVSIPMVNGALERSREATDAANERSFKSVLTISYVQNAYEKSDGSTSTFNVDTVYGYDAANGTIVEATAISDVYGKGTKAMGVDGQDRTKMALYGYISKKGEVKMCWHTTVPSNTSGVDRMNKTNGLTTPLVTKTGT